MFLGRLTAQAGDEPRHLLTLSDRRDLGHIALDDQSEVVVEPAVAARQVRSRHGERKPATQDALHVLGSRGGGGSRADERGRVVQQAFDEPLPRSVDLALRQRPQRDHVQAAGERLRGRRQARIARGAGEDEAPGP